MVQVSASRVIALNRRREFAGSRSVHARHQAAGSQSPRPYAFTGTVASHGQHNPALQAATADGPVVPSSSSTVQSSKHVSPSRVAYMGEVLASLRSTHRGRGDELVLARDHPTDVLPPLATDSCTDCVTKSHDYEI